MTIETFIHNASIAVGMAMVFGIFAFCVWFAVVYPEVRELSADEVAELRELARAYPTVATMVTGWMVSASKLRGRHLQKARVAAAFHRNTAQRQRENASLAAEVARLRQLVLPQSGRRVASVFGRSSDR